MTPVPNTIKGMVSRTGDLKYWVLGPSGIRLLQGAAVPLASREAQSLDGLRLPSSECRYIPRNECLNQQINMYMCMFIYLIYTDDICISLYVYRGDIL